MFDQSSKPRRSSAKSGGRGGGHRGGYTGDRFQEADGQTTTFHGRGGSDTGLPQRVVEVHQGLSRPTCVDVGEGASPLAIGELPVAKRTQRATHQRHNDDFTEANTEALFETHHNRCEDYTEVDVTPKDIAAVKSFEGLAIHPLLQANLSRCGYTTPNPVQQYGIPVCLAGKDLFACVNTGSGKTVAFLIPVVQHLLVHGVAPGAHGRSYPVALIMAPTRELAVQIFDESRKLAFKTDIWCDVVYGGGTSYPDDFEQDILVACPGRLTNIFDHGSVKFSRIKFLILEEVDCMLNMGFEKQIEYLVGSTDMPPPEQRQTFMFTATVSAPIMNLAHEYLRRVYYLLEMVRTESAHRNTSQRLMFVAENDKQDALMNLLSQHCQTDLVLVVVETINAAEDLNPLFSDWGIPCNTICGKKTSRECKEAYRRFKEGLAPVTVVTHRSFSTQYLEGIKIDHVIQYDLLQRIDHYIRHVECAAPDGMVTSFFNRVDTPLSGKLITYLNENDMVVPKWMENLPIVEKRSPRGGRRGRTARREYSSGSDYDLSDRDNYFDDDDDRDDRSDRDDYYCDDDDNDDNRDDDDDGVRRPRGSGRRVK